MKLTNFNFTVKQMSLKLLAIAFLTLVMLIPKFMITDLVNERARLNDDVNEEVATSWAKDQLITGPYLSIPYFKEVLNEKKEIVKEKQLFTLLPNTTKINGTLQTDERNRSIYNVLLYETDILFNSSFSLQDFNSLKIKPEFIVWKEAFVSLNISDPKGIKKEVLLECNNNKLKMNPGLNDLHITAYKEYSEKAIDKIKNRIFKTNDPPNTGLHTIIPLDSQIQEINISIPLSLKGSRGLLFTPTAKKLS
ncbi:MAG: hypothetical protein HOP11_03865, partial [Saprospiraceae bacterium]|nr:hypothetical protein [Saprospiraceae bacterium]